MEKLTSDIRIPHVAIRSGIPLGPNAPNTVHEGQRRNAVGGSLTFGNDLCDEASAAWPRHWPHGRIFIGESAGKICGMSGF
jgi:hypothetical protein